MKGNKMKAIKCLSTGALVVSIVTLGTIAHGQEIRWQPINATVPYTIDDQMGAIGVPSEIWIDCPPVEEMVTLEIKLSGWGTAPGNPDLASYQGTLDSSTLDSPVGGGLYPCCDPTCEDHAYIDTSRPDFVYFDNLPVCAVSVATPDYEYGCTQMGGAEVDQGIFYYGGTLIICVPAGAKGTYEIGWNPADTKTFFNNAGGVKIPGLFRTTGRITIITGKCCSSIGPGTTQCNDGLCMLECNAQPAPRLFFPGEECLHPRGPPANPEDCPQCLDDTHCEDYDACTEDHCCTSSDPYWTGTGCDVDGVAGDDYDPDCCFYLYLYDPLTECCSAADGSTNPLDDGNPCTEDTCEMRCTVGGNVCTDDSACDPADETDVCRGSGVALNSALPDGTSCDDGLFCNGTDICQAGVCQPGTEPCAANPCCDEDTDSCGAPCDFEYRCVIVPTPSLVDEIISLPSSVDPTMCDTFYVEFWATDLGTTNTGIVCAFADLDYPETCATAGPIQHTTLFGEQFPSGTVQPSIVDELGGCQFTGGKNIGVAPKWARIAYVEFTAKEACPAPPFELLPATTESAGFPPPRGLVPTWNIRYGSCGVEIQQACPCIYNHYHDDDDSVCPINLGDFSLFAPCWECNDSMPCWGAPDNCADYDYDGNGVVWSGDFSWFAAAWNRNCTDLDPMVDFPPNRHCDGPIVCPWPAGCGGGSKALASSGGQRTGSAGEPVLLTVRLTRGLSGPREAGRVDGLKPEAVKAGEHLFAEVWAKDTSPTSTGLTGVFSDVFYDPAQFEVVSVDPGQTFVLFTEARVDTDQGVIRTVGGATFEANHGVKRWTRISTVKLRALRDVARPRITLRPIEIAAIACRGQGLVAKDLIKIVNDHPGATGLIDPAPKRDPQRGR